MIIGVVSIVVIDGIYDDLSIYFAKSNQHRYILYALFLKWLLITVISISIIYTILKPLIKPAKKSNKKLQNKPSTKQSKKELKIDKRLEKFKEPDVSLRSNADKILDKYSKKG